jgi:hypothetical protein
VRACIKTAEPRSLRLQEGKEEDEKERRKERKKERKKEKTGRNQGEQVSETATGEGCNHSWRRVFSAALARVESSDRPLFFLCF